MGHFHPLADVSWTANSTVSLQDLIHELIIKIKVARSRIHSQNPNEFNQSGNTSVGLELWDWISDGFINICVYVLLIYY